MSDDTKQKMNEFFTALVKEYELISENAKYEISFLGSCTQEIIKSPEGMSVTYNSFTLGDLKINVITDMH